MPRITSRVLKANMDPVLVTGASGRLGSQIVRKLLDTGRTVVATDRVEPQASIWGPSSNKVEFVKADLCDSDAIYKLAAKAKSVIHVGAIPGPSQHPPPRVPPELAKNSPIGLESVKGIELMNQNLTGTAILFEAAASNGHSRVVFSSSLFAMGYSHDPSAFRPKYLPLDEEHGAYPLEHYGLSKVFGEEFAAMLTRAPGDASLDPPSKRPRSEALSFVSLRFSNIIKEEKWNELPLSWKSRPLKVTPLMWAYCHEHDVVDAHLKALMLPAEALASRCESFIIVADDTRYDLPTAEMVVDHFGDRRPFSSKLDGFASLVSNKKAKRVLGMSFRSFRTPCTSQSLSQDGSTSQASVFHAPADFILKSGIPGGGLKLVYQMYGALNIEKTNCILHPTSFDATHPELEFNVGPGKTLDTNRYCVLIVNLLGNGLSTSPSANADPSNVQEYPARGTSVCDNVRLQALLLDSLGIQELACIYGYSMGAMQALHWAAMYPNRVKRVAAVCGSAKPSDFNIVFLDSLEAALLADKDCDVSTGWKLLGPCQQGLKAFARIYAGWGVPRQFYQKEIWRKSSRDGTAFSSREDFVVRSYDKGFVNSNPLNLLAQVRMWRQGDISTAYGMPSRSTMASVLGRISARVYLMPCTTDSYFSAADIENEGQLIPNCRFLPIDSDWGHRAGDPHRPGQEADADFIRRHVQELLAEEVK